MKIPHLFKIFIWVIQKKKKIEFKHFLKGGSRFFFVSFSNSLKIDRIFDRIYGNFDERSDYDLRIVVNDEYKGEYLRDEKDGKYNLTV